MKFRDSRLATTQGDHVHIFINDDRHDDRHRDDRRDRHRDEGEEFEEEEFGIESLADGYEIRKDDDGALHLMHGGDRIATFRDKRRRDDSRRRAHDRCACDTASGLAHSTRASSIGLQTTIDQFWLKQKTGA